jgi:4-amino-4-deoxy-L-arabinose transferase-like glycosyltransferase
MTHRILLYAILAAYLVLAVAYSVVTPIFEASDELWHYPMVKYLADNGLQLPPQDPANIGPWRQEGSQPPLYYMIAAVLTSGIDTSDMNAVRRINPHADIGIIRPDGNINMIVHRSDLETFPWRGTTLAVHVVRFYSVLLGLGTVLVTYQLAREIFPNDGYLALFAAALNAFLPMFLFISGSVNNDNLSNLTGNLLTLLIVRLLKSSQLPHWRSYVWLGVVTGAGLLAKLNIGFLIPLIALALLILSLRLKSWQPLVVGGAISGLLTVAIAGWWYYRNWQLYNDPTGLNMFLSIVGRRIIPANAAQLWSERYSFTQAYWGFFGGVNLPLPDDVYTRFNLIAAAASIGLLAYFIFVFLRWRGLMPRTFLTIPSTPHWLPAAVTIIWPILTFVSYLRWTAETPASQGRLIFGALSSIALWMAVGSVWWLTGRWRTGAMALVSAVFLAANTNALSYTIPAAYTPPSETPSLDAIETFSSLDKNEGALELMRAEVLTQEIRPEQYVEMVMDWRVAEPLQRDWSMFIHLVTPDGVIISQRDVYPGGGLLATSDLASGRSWSNPVAIWVPFAAYAPMTLDVNVGWYHLPTGERLKLENGGETVMVGQVELLPRETELDVPNPISINFDNQIELVGYELSDLSPQAGDSLDLTLYWRAMRKIERDYVVFAHVIDPATWAIYAGSDAQPVQWQAPTSTWETGVIIEDKHTMTVSADSPPGIYELELGLYLQEADGSFPRLRIVTPDGGMADNFTYLSRVRILPAEG